MDENNLDWYRYHIDRKAKIEQIANMISQLENGIDEIILTESDWVTYVLPARDLLENLAEIVDKRSKMIVDDPIDWWNAVKAYQGGTRGIHLYPQLEEAEQSAE